MRLNFFNRIFLLSAAILFVLCACGTDSNKDADITEKAEIPNIESSSESSSSQHDNGVSADTGFIEENELNASAAEDGGDGWAEAEGGIADEQSSDGEQPENTAAEYALAVGNMANDKAGMDFQPINEMLMKQKQEELIQAEKEKMKKSGAKKENSGRNEPGAGGGEDYSGKTSGVNKPKLRHIGLKDLFSSSGMPSLFGSADKGTKTNNVS